MFNKESIIEWLEKSGKIGPHPDRLEMIRDDSLEMDCRVFSTTFIDCLMHNIAMETTIDSEVINTIIKCVSNSLAVFCNHSTKGGYETMYLVCDLMKIHRNYRKEENKTVKFRYSLLIDYYLHNIHEEFPVEMWDVTTKFLQEEFSLNQKPEIRDQGAHALNRFKNLDNSTYYIISDRLLFLMTSDSSADVRIAIVKIIVMINNVVDEMLKRSFVDIIIDVRKEAYKRFLTYPFLYLSPKQRQKILDKGLQEKNESIKSLIKKQLLPYWLKECKNDFEQLLKHIDSDIFCEKTLNAMFEENYGSQVLDLTKKFLNPVSCMIDFDKLTATKIFLWKYVAKYLTTKKKIDLDRNQGHIDVKNIDIVLPDSKMFSNYVREFYFTYNFNENKDFILTHLLYMAITFSIDEDESASIIKQLCLDLLLDNETYLSPIRPIVKLLDLTFENGQDLLIYVKQILNQILKQTCYVLPIMLKLVEKDSLQKYYSSKHKSILETLKDPTRSNSIDTLNLQAELEEINVSPEDFNSVIMAIKYSHKALELFFQVHKLPKVYNELSLLTDTMQEIIYNLIDFSMVSFQMEATRSITPHLSTNYVVADHTITTSCNEISNPMTHTHLLYKIMFDLFLRYDAISVDTNYSLDADADYFADYRIYNILPLLEYDFDYGFIHKSIKSIVATGFCHLLIYKNGRSIELLAKLFIIKFSCLSHDTFNLYHNLVKIFINFILYNDVSTDTYAKCYVPVMKEIAKHNLISKLNIKLDDVNTTFFNLTQGTRLGNKILIANTHADLASYIFDYFVENQPFSDTLVDLLCKLEIDFLNDDKLFNLLGSKLISVLLHLTHLNNNDSKNYMKIIMNKFNLILSTLKKPENRKQNDQNNFGGFDMILPVFKNRAGRNNYNNSFGSYNIRDERGVHGRNNYNNSFGGYILRFQRGVHGRNNYNNSFGGYLLRFQRGVHLTNTQIPYPVEVVPHRDLFSHNQMGIVLNDNDTNDDTDK